MSMRNPQNERYTVEREGRSAGATRPSTGSAKPASKAAASVRVQPTKTKQTPRQKAMAQNTMSKEERKAQRAKERELENLIYSATTTLTNKDPEYKKLRRIWWILLIGAVCGTALSWMSLATGFGGEAFSIVVLVLAYAGIIGALVMDFTVIRKRRNFWRGKVASMTRKQVERLVEESYVEQAAQNAGKKARKEAKKAGKSAAEQEAAFQKAVEETLAAGKSKRGLAELAAGNIAGATPGAKAAEKAGESGTTKVTELAEGVEGEAAPAAEPTAEELEEARKAAAAKAAREFAASRR